MKHLNGFCFFLEKNSDEQSQRHGRRSSTARKENFKIHPVPFPFHSDERQLLFVYVVVDDNMNSVHNFCRDKEKPRLLILPDGRGFDLF